MVNIDQFYILKYFLYLQIRHTNSYSKIQIEKKFYENFQLFESYF